jgi:hypothetical protein
MERRVTEGCEEFVRRRLKVVLVKEVRLKKNWALEIVTII